MPSDLRRPLETVASVAAAVAAKLRAVRGPDSVRKAFRALGGHDACVAGKREIERRPRAIHVAVWRRVEQSLR